LSIDRNSGVRRPIRSGKEFGHEKVLRQADGFCDDRLRIHHVRVFGFNRAGTASGHRDN
jgi:hypothetical protein